ncbi:WD40 repeat-like protein [Rhizopogon vinicolor AM-OR11-026]|uniref:WD40 repeat-like protein n=1 Tax=Rhizopogon vinicolor AM-OR11-026 TaxID=1314800 RepID=A0A1B7N0S7_9AGAM|nr:WD40 repeat-like protein [Rhizopogon vinicolor AM-OR11-026]
MRGHTDTVYSVAHLPGRRQIITCSEDGLLRLWDTESGAQIGDDWRDEGEKAGVIAIALSPNGETVASGGRDGKVTLWDVEKRKVIAKWTGSDDLVESVCWSGDGERILSGFSDGTVRVWNVERGNTLLSKIEHEATIWSLAWTSDQKKLIAGSGNGSITILDTTTRKQTAILGPGIGGVYALCLFQNDRLLASTSHDHTARLWNLDTNTQVGQLLQHESGVNGAAFSPDGKLLAIGCRDKNAYVWDIYTILKDAGLEDLLSLPNVTLSPNGKTVASGSRDGKVKLWDVERRKVIVKWTGHSHLIWSMCWSADGERVLSGSDDGTVRVWDVERGNTVLGPITTGHKSAFAAIYSHDITKIATGGKKDGIKIWDANTGELLSTIEHQETVWCLAWTSDQKKLIAGSNNGLIRIFDTATWKQTAILEDHKDGINAICLFQNDRLFASTSLDETACLWNIDTNIQVGQPLQHEHSVAGAAFSPDGKLLATGCEDNNVYVWDIYTILKDAGLEDLLSLPNVCLNSLGSILSSN